jgi:glycosyltransferase involved in cell wall biosynthesis
MGNSAIELRHVLHAYEQLDDVDIVHDHTLVGAALAAGRDDLPPVVTTNHGEFNTELSALYRYVAPHIPVIAISRHQASTAAGIEIAAVIHHGIDSGQYAYGTGDGGYLLFLGRMAATKGVDVAARAARRAGVPLLIAAKMREATERDYFEHVVRPLLGSGIEYVGEVDREEKLQLLRGARALLNPIQWDEPFGMVMIESLACGTPVLAFPNGAAPEIVDHGVTGFLCDDEDDLVHRLGRVGDLSRLACRRAAIERFSTARMVADHVALYEQVARGRPTAVHPVALAVTRPPAAGSFAATA